jgi:hypothetical protein
MPVSLKQEIQERMAETMSYENLLNDFLMGPDLLENKVSSLSEEQLLFRPALAGAWSIKEHVIHVVDSEINNFIRWKSIIAQPKSKVFVIEEEDWTRRMDYQSEDMNKYLQTFRLLRNITHDYLIDLEDKLWESEYFVREYQGKTDHVTLLQDITIYANHVPFHLEYIERNLKAFQDAR